MTKSPRPAPPARLMLLDAASLYFRAFYGVPRTVHRPGRHAGERRPRVAGHDRLPGAGAPAGAAGRLLGRGLATGLPGGRDPVLQGAPGRAGPERAPRQRRRSSPRSCRSSPRRWPRSGSPAPGPPGTRPTTSSAPWSPGTPAAAGRRSTSSPATGTCSSWWTTRAGSRCSTSAKGVRDAQARRRGLAAREVRRALGGAGYADMAVLRGDPSDGLPGVPGIGEKTAAGLLAGHGDLAGLLKAVEDPASGLSGAQRRKLTEAGDYLAVAPGVVLVARDAPVSEHDDAVPREPGRPGRGAGAGRAVGAVLQPDQAGRGALSSASPQRDLSACGAGCARRRRRRPWTPGTP